MYKPASLRRHLSAAVPELARDPDKLSLLVKSGRVACAGSASLSFEYRYTLQLVVLDYAGAADAIVLPTLVWMRTHQPEYFDNPQQRDADFRFEAEYNNATTIDLLLELQLTERVRVQPVGTDATAPGRFQIDHLGEPLHPGKIQTAEQWSFWAKGGLLAEWVYDPREFDHAPRMES